MNMKKHLALACMALALFTAGTAQAQTTCYYDNVTGAGFGAAGGTWAAPTPGPTPGWTTDGTGAAVPGSVTTGTGDTLNFGNGALGLGAGTITVSGTVDAGDMTFASGSGAITLQTGTITLGATSTITVNNAADTISSVLSGAATSLTKIGAGTLTLSGANTYSGATTVNAGTLKLDFSAATAPTTDIISSSSALVLGGGTLNLTGKASTINSQAVNGTTINPGLSAITLTANATANPLSLSLGAITRNVGSALRITQPAGTLSSINGVLTTSGTGGAILLHNGVAYATIGYSNWAGMDASNTWIAPPTYTAATATSLSGNASFDVGGGFTTTLSSNTTITSLRKPLGNTVTLTLNGSTLTTGGILITDGVGDRSFTINGSGSLRGPAGQDLVFLNYPGWNGHATIISVPIVDNGSATGFTYSGNGDDYVFLTGSNTYTGTTRILGGVLKIGNGGTTGSLDPSSQIVNNGSLIINRSDNLTFSNTISGTGSLTKSGAGTLTLSGNNTYAGATTLNAGGKLLVSGDQSLATGAVAVASGATLGGGGIIGGAVTVVANGRLAPGISLGTLTVGTPSVNKNVGVAGGVWDIEINGGTGQADKLYVNGNLTWSGTQTLNFTNLAGSAPGTYTFAEWTGTGTSPVGAWVVPANNTENHWIGGTDLLWDTKTNWNPDSVQSGSVALNGKTLQLTVSQDDAPASGSSIYIDPDADVVVSGPASGGKQTVNNLTIGKGTGVNTAALVLQSGGNLTVTGATTVRSGGTLTATAAGLISPILNVNGGTVLLNGANGAIASSTGITIGPAAGTTGTLTLDNSSDNNSDRVSSVAMTMNNGTLNFIGNATTASTETIGAITAAVGHNQIVLSNLSTLTSTAGAVTRTAGATLNILADGTSQQFKFTGGTAGINKGVFYGATAATANEFAYYPGSGAAVVAPTYDGSGNFATPATTLTASKHNKLSGDDASEGAISIYSLNMPSNYSLTALTGNLTFTNAVDQGAIIKSGGGAAQIGTAGNLFDIVGVAGGELVINTVAATDNLTLNVGVTATTTALTKTGAGTLTLTANRDYLYTGATYVNAGTLVLNSLNTAGFKSSVTINNGGTAKLGASDKIIDTAVFTVNAGGTFDLAGSSERIGALAGSGSVTNTGGAATLTLQASSTFSGVISGNTALTLVNIGPFVLSGQNTYSGATTVTGDAGGGPTIIKLGVNNALPSGGILNLGTFAWFVNLDLAGYDQTVGPLTTGGQNGSVATVYNSVGASKLTLSGGATAVTTPLNYHTGPTFIAVTTLDLNNAAQTFNVADGISVNELTISSVIQNGALTKTGTGGMLLSGANTYAGATTISGGTLEIGGAGVLGSGAYAANITNNATFSYNSTASQTLSGVISGTGALVKNNTGTLNLTGANTYSGVTTVSAGTLLVNGSLNVTSRVTVASGATLAGAGTMGIVTNDGTLAVGNGATMGTLTTSNLVMGASSSYVFDLNGTGSGDSVTVNGALTLNGSSVITIVPQGVFNGGYTYTLFNYKTVSGTLPTTVLGGNPKRPMTLIDDTANKRIILKVEGPPGTVISFF